MLFNIKNYICEKYNINHYDLKSQRRLGVLVNARREYIYLLKKNTSMSYPEMGRLLNRDHTTIMHNYNRAEELVNDGYMKVDYVTGEKYNSGAVHVELERALDDAWNKCKSAIAMRLEKDPVDTINRLTKLLT